MQDFNYTENPNKMSRNNLERLPEAIKSLPLVNKPEVGSVIHFTTWSNDKWFDGRDAGYGIVYKIFGGTCFYRTIKDSMLEATSVLVADYVTCTL